MSTASKDPVDDVRIISVPAIIAIIGAVVGAIGSLAASAVLVIGALKDTTKAVEAAAIVATAESDRQDAALKEIHVLVNDNLSELKGQLNAAMEELKSSREDLAILAGRQAERDDQAVEDAVTDKDP